MPTLTANVMTAQVDSQYPNRILLFPSTQGPFTNGVREFDPMLDINLFINGLKVSIVSAVYTPSTNSYALYTSRNFDASSVIQLVHHLPETPFQSV